MPSLSTVTCKQLKAVILGVNYPLPSNTDTCSYVFTPFPCLIPADPVKAYIFKRSNRALKLGTWWVPHGKKHTPAPTAGVNLNMHKSTSMFRTALLSVPASLNHATISSVDGTFLLQGLLIWIHFIISHFCMIIPSVWGGAEVGSLQFLPTPLLRQYDSVERLCSAMCYLNVIKGQHNYPIQP